MNGEYEKELRDCTDFDKVDGILDKLEIPVGNKPRWEHLHKVMGITRVFGVQGNPVLEENEKDKIEYDISREMLVSQKWKKFS